MKFHKSSTYPYPSDVVIQLFSDPDYFLEKYRLTGASHIQLLDHHIENDISSITVRRDVSLEIPLPRFAQALIDDTVTLIQTDTWDRQRKTGTLSIHMKGAPAIVRCHMALSDQREDTRLDLEFEIDVNVPLVGQKIAALMARDLDRKFQRDDEKGKTVMASLAPRYQS